MSFVTSRVAAKELDLHPNTLRRLAKEGRIDHIVTPAGQRRYNIKSFISNRIQKDTIGRKKVCYCRVSSLKQKPDLERQKAQLKQKYPDHEFISDIGSSLNYKRPGFNSLLEQVHKGEISEVVVTYKDRLARFGFDLISRIFELNQTKIMVLNNREVSQEQELTEDLIRIITVYTARYYGRRKYKPKTPSEETEERSKTTETQENQRKTGSETENDCSQNQIEANSEPEEHFKQVVRGLKVFIQQNNRQDQSDDQEQTESST